MLILSDALSTKGQNRLIESLQSQISMSSSGSTDATRLSLLVIRILARQKFEVKKTCGKKTIIKLSQSLRSFIPKLAPVVFSRVKDPVAPVKFSAELVWADMFNLRRGADDMEVRVVRYC